MRDPGVFLDAAHVDEVGHRMKARAAAAAVQPFVERWASGQTGGDDDSR